jgi:uncharacterized damage-inducible protein DinB
MGSATEKSRFDSREELKSRLFSTAHSASHTVDAGRSYLRLLQPGRETALISMKYQDQECVEPHLHSTIPGHGVVPD